MKNTNQLHPNKAKDKPMSEIREKNAAIIEKERKEKFSPKLIAKLAGIEHDRYLEIESGTVRPQKKKNFPELPNC